MKVGRRWNRITILSPHRDDAVFSVALWMKHWAALNECRVLNFYTQSVYAPELSDQSIGYVSTKRLLEDNRAIRRVSPSIKNATFGMLDAPLRLSLPFERLMRPDALKGVADEQIEAVAMKIQSACQGELVIAPLALGYHVDHQIVSAAAQRVISPRRLAFYEDLPYATWTAEDSIKNRVDAISTVTKAHYRAIVRRDLTGRTSKYRQCRTYSSQIEDSVARDIANYTRKYRSGERIWIPSGGSGWLQATANSHARAFPPEATAHRSTSRLE